MAFTEVLFNWTTFAFSKVIFWHDYFYSVLLHDMRMSTYVYFKGDAACKTQNINASPSPCVGHGVVCRFQLASASKLLCCSVTLSQKLDLQLRKVLHLWGRCIWNNSCKLFASMLAYFCFQKQIFHSGSVLKTEKNSVWVWRWHQCLTSISTQVLKNLRS